MTVESQWSKDWKDKKIYLVYKDESILPEDYGDFYYLQANSEEEALKKVQAIRPECEWKVREAVWDEDGFLT